MGRQDLEGGGLGAGIVALRGNGHGRSSGIDVVGVGDRVVSAVLERLPVECEGHRRLDRGTRIGLVRDGGDRSSRDVDGQDRKVCGPGTGEVALAGDGGQSFRAGIDVVRMRDRVVSVGHKGFPTEGHGHAGRTHGTRIGLVADGGKLDRRETCG